MGAIIAWLEQLARSTSIEVFGGVGAFLEELIAPIPSPFVMTTVAALAQVREYSLWQMVLVTVIASAAKTVASWIIYVAADKAEDFVFKKFSRFLPISHKQIEQIGSYLTGSWWDDVLLFIARALPIVPSSAVSVAAGVIKYEMRSYIIMTFLGSIIRNGFFLWVGYVGVEGAAEAWQQLQGHPVILALLGVLVVVVFIALMKVKDVLWENVILKKKSE